MKKMVPNSEAEFTYYDHLSDQCPQVSNAEQAYKLLLNNWEQVDEEQQLRLLMLDKRCHLLVSICLSRPGIKQAILYPEKLVSFIPAYRAEYLVVAHNTARQVDPYIVQLVRGLLDVTRLKGMTLIDHLIVTSKRFSSTAGRQTSYRRLAGQFHNPIRGAQAGYDEG